MTMRHYFRHIALAFACMLSLSTLAQTTQWRDIYTAKKKDTIFGIARKYNITVDELVEANPAMKGEGYKLKKGEMVFIPFEKTKADLAEYEKKYQEILDKAADAMNLMSSKYGIEVDI